MLEVIELSGSHYEMGRQHGSLLKESIHRLSHVRLEIAVNFAADHHVTVTRDDCLRIARACLPIHERYSRPVYDEWRGIADGAELPIEDVFFANALTDFQDLLWQAAGVEVHGCTSFAVAADAAEGGSALIGQTWDMHASAEEHIRVFRRVPDDGPRSLTMTTAGCLSLIGLNESGIAVGNNNLRPTDARNGVIYLAMLHEALRQTNWNAARASITSAPRMSGHNYIMADADGHRADIETTAAEFHEFTIDTSWYVHTNHYLAPRLQPLEDPTIDRRSTEFRLARLREKMNEQDSALSPNGLRRLLSDHDGDDNSICRHGEGHGPRSCAFVVCDPAKRCLHVSPGPPCEGKLTRFEL